MRPELKCGYFWEQRCTELHGEPCIGCQEQSPMNNLTDAQVRVLTGALKREDYHVCPTVGVHAAAQTALLNSLRRKGYVTPDHSPRMTDAGRSALLAALHPSSKCVHEPSEWEMDCPHCNPPISYPHLPNS